MRLCRRSLALAAVLLVTGACGDSTGESPEIRGQREAAFRQACTSGILARRAQENLDVLNGTLANMDPADPLTELTRGATNAAIEYARAYQRHADLRLGAYALVDSAVNWSSSSQDSTGYATRAAAFSVRLPAEGSVEANVLQSYQNDLTALLSDPNLPCNWDFPF